MAILRSQGHRTGEGGEASPGKTEQGFWRCKAGAMARMPVTR